jgi:hypothetical protein
VEVEGVEPSCKCTLSHINVNGANVQKKPVADCVNHNPKQRVKPQLKLVEAFESTIQWGRENFSFGANVLKPFKFTQRSQNMNTGER